MSIFRKKKPASVLRHRVTLQAPVETHDEGGHYTRSWEDVAELWANIMPLSAKEVLRDHYLQHQITHRIFIRHRDNVTAACRIVYDGRLFNIKSVLNVEERSHVLEILAQEGVAV